jgi:hypothetical protein
VVVLLAGISVGRRATGVPIATHMGKLISESRRAWSAIVPAETVWQLTSELLNLRVIERQNHPTIIRIVLDALDVDRNLQRPYSA